MLSYVYDYVSKYTYYGVYPKIYPMPRRGINYKKVLVTLDEECVALLETKKLHWDGFNQSAYIRRCIKMGEKTQKQTVSQESSFEEKSVNYD